MKFEFLDGIFHMPIDDSKALINASGSRKNNPKFGKFPPNFKPRICTNYDKIGHIVETFYKKHGLPPHLHCSNAYVALGITLVGSKFVTSNSFATHGHKGAFPSLTRDQYVKCWCTRGRR